MSSRSLPEPRFSIVVVAYNSRENLPACLESCRRAFGGASGGAEVIVVDNASRDGTGEWLRKAPDVRALLNKENLGFSKACNQGARLAQGEFLLFLNPDALLTSGACERMAAAFSNPKVGAAGPASNYVAGLQRLDRHWPASAGSLENLPGTTAWEKSEAISETLRTAHGGETEDSKLLIGFCLMIPRRLFLGLGGFDENLFLGNDDLELSWRLRLRGYRLIVARDAFVFHEGQKSFRTESKSVTDVLVQESTDALFRKLSLHYGGDEKVPPPEELWGIGWFQPSPAAYSVSVPSSPATSLPPSPSPSPSPEAFMPAATAPQTHPATQTSEDGLFLHYPETLRALLQDAERVGFAGTAVAPVSVSGALHGVDIRGIKAAFSGEDLLILRISPDMVDDLPARLRNVRERLPNLKRLVAVLNSRQALGRPPHPRGFEVPVDVTCEGVCAALRLSGFRVTSMVPYPGFPGTHAAGPRVGWWQVDAEPRPRGHRLDAKVSIIMLGFNQLEYTKQCVESIRANVRQDHELILVDNGSRDGTWSYFQSVPGAVAIRNETNRGVSAGWNQGLRAATGEYLLVLNNDTLIFPDMVENLVRLCESDPAVGVAGPRCNRIAAAQAVEGVAYHTPREMEAFARDWQQGHDLASAEYDWIKGTCMLIPRGAFEKIGLFDERYGKGNFEDDDYCLRARYHGFKTCIAHDSYLHHYGSVSFGQENVDWNALMLENQRKFEAKWRHGAAALNDVQVGSAPGEQTEGWLAEGREAYGRGELDKARAIFLKLLEAEPGHAEALSALGALSFHEGRYRDAALLSMRSLTRRPEDQDTALNLLEALEALNGKVSGVERDALRQRFPANPGFAESAAGRSWTPVAESDSVDWKTVVEENIRAKKYGDALDFVENRIKAGQEIGACQNFMGVIAMACGKSDDALGYFRKAVRLAPAESDFTLNLAETLVRLDRAPEALHVLEEAHEARPGAEFQAAAEQLRRELAAAEPRWDEIFLSWDVNATAEQALREGQPGEAQALLTSGHLDRQPGDFRAWNNRGVAAFQQGDAEEAWRCFGKALDAYPAYGDALANAFDAAILTRNLETLARRVQSALAADPDNALAGRMRRHLEREGDAVYASQGFDALEQGAEILERAETDMKQGRPHEALRGFLDAVDKRPANPQAMNGLGIIAFAQNRFEDAYKLFEEAARLNPADQDILINLWEAARSARREQEARPALEASLSRNPGFQDVREILSRAR